MNFTKFWVKEDGKEYDEVRRRAAGQKAILYYLVALYVGYMGYSILNNWLSGDRTISYALLIVLTAALFIGAIWVAWYATKRMKNEFKLSEIKAANKEESQDL